MSSVSKKPVIVLKKYTVSFTDLSGFAANTGDVQLFSAAPGTIIHAAKIKPSTGFGATGQTTCKVTLGITGSLASIQTVGLELDSTANPPSDTNQWMANIGNVAPYVVALNSGSATSVRAAFTSNVFLSTLEGGSLDVWVWISVPIVTPIPH